MAGYFTPWHVHRAGFSQQLFSGDRPMTAHERAQALLAQLRYSMALFGISPLTICTAADLLAQQQAEWLP
jgi:hypothetical protein